MAIGFLGLKFWKDFNVSRSSFPDLLVWEGCGALMTIFPLELAEKHGWIVQYEFIGDLNIFIFGLLEMAIGGGTILLYMLSMFIYKIFFLKDY